LQGPDFASILDALPFYTAAARAAILTTESLRMVYLRNAKKLKTLLKNNLWLLIAISTIMTSGAITSMAQKRQCM
jgi:hypothetical protein